VAGHGFAVAECLHFPPMEINENQQVFSGFAGRMPRGDKEVYRKLGLQPKSGRYGRFSLDDAHKQYTFCGNLDPRPMSRTSHRTRIHDALRSRLLQGEIAPDMRLVDHAIAAEMGVSRMPVREALMQLVSEGYLESTSRGFRLAEPEPRPHRRGLRPAPPSGAACRGRGRPRPDRSRSCRHAARH
jgi:hypothetical protein